MSIVQRAISALVGPAIASAQAALVARIEALEALEARPALTDADRAAIAQAVALVAEFEALAGGSPTLDGDVVMVTDVP
jgi:hypothetical protein